MHDFEKELPYWLALLRAPGIGPIKFKKILTHFPKLSELFSSEPVALQQYGFTETFINYLHGPDWPAVEKDLLWLEQSKGKIITLFDINYPSQLQEIAGAPPLLFVRGNIELLTSAQLAMVGSRTPSYQGINNAKLFAAELATLGLTITSGLALGIDTAGHEGCLTQGGKTIAVLANGLDQIYPARNSALAEKILCNGAILSEFPPGTPPIAENFPRRNRIISGLSFGVFVIEAALQSGSLITARYALEQGREVFAMPGSIHNPLTKGCHLLIKEGAKLVESTKDLLDELSAHFTAPGFHLPKEQPPSSLNKISDGLAKEHIKLLECLDFEYLPIDRIIEYTELPANKTGQLLMELELKGLVVAVAGGYAKKTLKF